MDILDDYYAQHIYIKNYIEMFFSRSSIGQEFHYHCLFIENGIFYRIKLSSRKL